MLTFAMMFSTEKTEKPGSPDRVTLASPIVHSCRTGWQEPRPYALKELPQPHVVFACGFLMENPDPWTLST